MLKRLAAVLVLLWLSAAALPASERRERIDVISIHHAQMTLTGSNGSDQGPLLAVNTFDLRSDETMRLDVADPNPLLFTYKASEIVTTDTADFAEASTFLRSLTGLLEVLKTTAGRTAELAPGLTDRTETWEQFMPARFSRSVGDVARHLEDMKKYVALSIDSPVAVKQDVLALDLPTLVSDLREDLTNLEAVADTCLAGRDMTVTIGSSTSSLACTATSTDPKVREIQSFVALALTRASRLRDAASMLEQFHADASAIHVPITLVKAISYVVRSRQAVTVTIAGVSRYVRLLDPVHRDKVQKQTGTFEFQVEPHSPVRLSAGPALVYGFVRNPTFTAAEQGESFVIRETQSDYTAYTAAAMLNITPRAWAEPTFGGHFQIGVTPAKDDMAFYAGAGLQLQRLFTIGAGITWRQVNELGNGLAVGQVLASSGELTTNRRFRSGVYLHVTLTP